MEIRIFCNSCKTEILRADTDTLKTPLIGGMFKVKKHMEWSMFSPGDKGLDLTCPMCEWTFHDNGKIVVAVDNDLVIGLPEIIVPGILAYEMNSIEKEIPTTNITASEIEERTDKFEKESGEGLRKTHKPAVDAIREAGSNALKSLQKQVELAFPVNHIVESIENESEKEPEKVELPQLNRGDWSEAEDADEKSEAKGEAPPGTVATEPAVRKKKGVPRAKLRKGYKRIRQNSRKKK